tara:strand:- start:408 stop:584 length:177 start_codon:yes stop_codon:yes gene_type:complete
MTKKTNEVLHYEVITQEDENGDLILPIPPELLAKLGWKENDTIHFSPSPNGGFTLRKT